MIEYCQVHWRDNEVVATDGIKLLASGNSFIGVFNKLGRDNWRMCWRGQIQNADKTYSDTIFYFERKVKE